MFDIRKIQEDVILNSVEEHSNHEIAKAIVYGEDGDILEKDNAAWVQAAMHRLESKFDKTTVKQIRMGCQCGYGMDEKIALLKELAASSSSLAELANLDQAKAAGLLYENESLYLKFDFCPCPMLAEVKRLDSKTWCECTTGYSKVLFEKAFGVEVEVELLKSIKTGDDICLMKIIPLGEIWK